MLMTQLQNVPDVLPAVAIMLWMLPGLQYNAAATWMDIVHFLVHTSVRRAPETAPHMLTLLSAHSVVQRVLSNCQDGPALFGLTDLLGMLAKQTAAQGSLMPANATALLHMYVICFRGHGLTSMVYSHLSPIYVQAAQG